MVAEIDKNKTMAYITCPQCGDSLTPDINHRVRCGMCGWGQPDGIDVRGKHKKAVAYFMDRSLRWRLALVAGVFAAVLVVPTLVLIPVNEVRASNAITNAKKQMDRRLYASAAKTIHQAPREFVAPSKVKQMKQLLSDNVRWGRDISGVKTAKSSLTQADPELALDELADLEEDFPHEDEALELIDLAQELSFDPDLELDQEFLDDLAFTPDDPEFASLGELGEELDLEESDISLDDTAGGAGNPAGTPRDEPIEAGEDIFEEVALLPGEEDELPDVADPPVGELPPNSGAAKLSLSKLYFLFQPKQADSLYTIDLSGEVTPAKDSKSGQTGFQNKGVIGSIYNKKVNKYKKRIVPLYRYYSQKNTDHFYSTNRNFSANNTSANYQRQAVVGYIGLWYKAKGKCVAGKKPLHSLFNQKTKTTRLTISPSEKTQLQQSGYTYSGPVGCIW